MFKVQCLGCQAPYQVDERRVPQKGLQMRCPKCGTSFNVEPPGASSSASPATPDAEQGATPPEGSPQASGGGGGFSSVPAGRSGKEKRDLLARTMIGVSAKDLELGAEAAPPRKKPPAPPPRRRFRIPRPGAPGAAEQARDTPIQAAPVDVPLASEAREESEPASSVGTRPTPVAPAPSIEADLPAVPVPLAPPTPRATVDLDLPAALEPSVRRDAGGKEVDLPAVPAPKTEADLPAVFGGLAADADLPAKLEDLERAGSPPDAFPDESVDLPAVMGGSARQDVEKPIPSPVAPPREMDERDLPAVMGSGGRREVGSASLDVADLPRVAAPAAAHLAGIGESGLELEDVELPAVGHRRQGAAPAPAGLNDLPGLPEPGLPEVGGAGLPSVIAADLPQLGGSLPEVASQGVAGFGQLDLPTTADAPLPDVSASLPDVSASLPDVSASLPDVGGALPATSDHGEAGNLPLVGNVLPEAVSSDAGPAFGSFAGGDEGDDPFVGEEAAFGVGEEAAFGNVEEAPFGSGEEMAFGDPDGEEDPFGPGDAPDSLALGELVPTAASTDAEVDPPVPETGSAYGEVEVGEGDVASESLETEDMEFDAIPQQSSSPPGGSAAASASVHRPESAELDVGSTLELGGDPKPKSRGSIRRLSMAAAVCVSVVAGAALALEPSIGPFGAHFVMDRVKRGDHERLLDGAREELRQAFERDGFAEVRTGLEGLSAARAKAPRFEAMKAQLALSRFAAVLRFGPDAKLEAEAKAAFGELRPDEGSLMHQLAAAARAAALREPNAGQLLQALGSHPEARTLLAELQLRSREFEAASAGWTAIVAETKDSPRALFGHARAQLALGRMQDARTSLDRLVEKNASHFGARVLRLELQRAWSAGSAAEDAGGVDTVAASRGIEELLAQASPGEAAWAHGVLGELHSSYGREAQAQKAFEKALELNRASPRALAGLGEVLFLAGRHSEARARFDAARRADPKSLQAQIGVAKSQIHLAQVAEAKASLDELHELYKSNAEVVYWMAKAEQALDQDAAALRLYRVAIELGQGRADTVRAYLALADLQTTLGQLTLARKTLSEARKKLPPSGELFEALGELSSNEGRYEQAYAHFQKALELDSGDTRARFLGAVALTRLGRFDAALAAFDGVSEIDEDYPGLALERGRLLEESGRTQQALAQYESALEKAPDNLELKLRVGCARVLAGKSEGADTLLLEVLRQRPRSAEAYHCLGRWHFERREFVEAMNRLERSVALDPSRALYHLYVGWVANEVGRHADAESALQRALEIDRGLADALWQRGRLRRKQGAVKDAIVDLERALRLKPALTEALADLAVAYADLGRVKRAVRAWEEALSRDGDRPKWLYRYGKLLSANGQAKRAVQPVQKAIELVQPKPGASLEGPVDEPPVWLWQAHYLVGRGLGRVARAVPHWQAYLRLSPRDNPYRREAKRALAALGQPWQTRP